MCFVFAAFHVKHAGPPVDFRRRSESRGRKIGQVVLGAVVLRHTVVHQSQQRSRAVRHRRTVAAVVDRPNAILRKKKRYVQK